MQRKYYYLIPSLVDIFLDMNKNFTPMKDFFLFCSEEMHENDFEDLKKLFLFNDIRNVINYQKADFIYQQPSYYSQDEFNENLKDTDSFLPFIAEYFFNKSREKRTSPELMEIDELVWLLYQYLDDINDTFLVDYYLFELDLQNITTALSLRKNSLPYLQKIIPFGENYQSILKSNSPDLGLSGKIDYLDNLIDLYKGDDLVQIEKEIENIRWKWLDEKVETDFFSKNFIYSYAVKLESVTRWFELDEENGRQMLDKLINEIKKNVFIPDEFLRR
jgi:hypothetical protein